jgi:hypothetical protein
MRRSLFIAFVAGVVGGCYLRPAPPPGFRYSCDADDDCQALDCGGKAISLAAAAELIEGCDSAEVQANPALGVAYRQSCRGGLCEYPCGLLTYQQDCPTTEGFAFCFNGACASLCGTDDFNKYKGYESNDDFCTEPQTCIPLGPDGIDPALLGSSGGGGGSSNLAEGAGFCGQRCDAKDAPPCPARPVLHGRPVRPRLRQPRGHPLRRRRGLHRPRRLLELPRHLRPKQTWQLRRGQRLRHGPQHLPAHLRRRGRHRVLRRLRLRPGPRDLPAHQLRHRRRLLEQHHLRDGP